MPMADDYWIDWCAHRGAVGVGGVITHAVPEGTGNKAVCGTVTTGDGHNLTLAEAGDIGCRRCRKILTVAGVLPPPAHTE